MIQSVVRPFSFMMGLTSFAVGPTSPATKPLGYTAGLTSFVAKPTSPATKPLGFTAGPTSFATKPLGPTAKLTSPMGRKAYKIRLPISLGGCIKQGD